MRRYSRAVLLIQAVWVMGLIPAAAESADQAPSYISQGRIKLVEMTRRPEKKSLTLNPDTLVGKPQHHRIEKGETLLDIARRYDLGINELQDLYPKLDPWIPPEGTDLIIPSQWILPASAGDGILINVAELRLFYFMKTRDRVKTFPISIGRPDEPTPPGVFAIGEKRAKPTWFIPPDLQQKYGVKAVAPGPDNPLGNYWMGLRHSNYGIHGTDIPWSVGRMVTGGCIRLYPEDIEQLFKWVRIGTPVKIIYEPVKFGFLSGRLYVEVHRDVYNKMGDLVNYGLGRLRAEGLVGKTNLDSLLQALLRQDGMPVDISFDKPPE
ncbi:MAG: L,D-transpeptidase family protein [Deltaproteobacteria bacterium]|nr:L,D-transpeptidase family protein [Deltaproteobacteria bacterium]